jgi:hypothetical protein
VALARLMFKRTREMNEIKWEKYYFGLVDCIYTCTFDNFALMSTLHLLLS